VLAQASSLCQDRRFTVLLRLAGSLKSNDFTADVCPAAEIHEDATEALEEVRRAVAEEDWEAGRVAYREALRLLVAAGMTKEVEELEGLEQRLRDGEGRARERREGSEHVQRAKAALGAGDFEEAREALREARGAFRRGGWEEGERELQGIVGLVEAGERRATRRREGDQALAQAKVPRCRGVVFYYFDSN
jgi:hypothetical protein